MKKKIFLASMALLLLCSSGCGTLFFSHRIGKKMSKKIDNKVFYTNCFLCLFGVIPGVVAFILDYDNESIYYTEAELIPDDFSNNFAPEKMKRISGIAMTDENISSCLSHAIGKPVNIASARFRPYSKTL